MPELRQDPLTGRWVIISPERGKRPSDYETIDNGKHPRSEPCPFCGGNEWMTPPAIFTISPNGFASHSYDWAVRVIANKFPALRVEGGLERHGVGMYDQMSGIGAHEVIVESPIHDRTIRTLSIDHVSQILRVCRDRITDLYRDSRLQYVQIFKNFGEVAGASLEHSHMQLLATPILPKHLQEKLENSYKHWKIKRRSIYQDIIDAELLVNQRVVWENADFIALCPYASRFPFEVMILPKAHHSSYTETSDQQVLTLAEIIKQVLARWFVALGDIPYNMVFFTAPSEEVINEAHPSTHFHHRWHIEMLPRLTRTAGFEWGTGFHINHTLPEVAAKYMRELNVDITEVKL